MTEEEFEGQDHYDPFMIYELDDSGERILTDITEDEFREDNGKIVLHPEQVVVIVKEDIRRIYIWKGSKSPVRKRFISSRVAQGLQEELVKVAAFHRCKIVSVDQGDEPVDFLNAFDFESMEVTEVLEDMRYVRNVDREKAVNAPEPKKSKKKVKSESDSGYYSPALEELEEETGKKIDTGVKMASKKKVKTVSSPPSTPKPTSSRRSRRPRRSYSRKSRKSAKKSTLSQERRKEIMDKIVEMDLPKNHKRQNLVIGHTLYGAVSKKVDVLGKEILETEWEPVKKLPKGMIELDDVKLRVYFDEEEGKIVEALEILKKQDSSVKEIKEEPQVVQPSKKEEKEEKPEEETEEEQQEVKEEKRELPKIPSAED
ncbi:MAG: hypothetical protein R6U96_03360 [Promethearchaeia archaeon]